jgi:16S rRNA processing protein RimM
VPSPGDEWDQMVLVGTIGRPHGIRGAVTVRPETDFVDERFRAGSVVWTRSTRGEERLTIATARTQGGRLVIGFDGFGSIEEAERLTNLELRVPESALQPLDAGVYYHHQLVGCVVETSQDRIGEVVRVEGGAAGSLLVIAGAHGDVLIPLVADICVEIYVTGRRIRIAPPDGLLELNERHS